MTELWKKYRPTTLDEVVGQDMVVGLLKNTLREKKLPHAVMLIGPTGTGKTTIARILAGEVGSSGGDLSEVPCPTVDPMETVREIGRNSGYYAMAGEGKSRSWIMDEFQSFSRAGFAQQGMLKILEECPSHVYFFILTTDPDKIIAAVKNRCLELKLSPVGNKGMVQLLGRVVKAEGAKVADIKVLDRIMAAADGSPRKALELLERVLNFTSEDDQLAVLQKADGKAQAFDLCRALFDPNKKWPDVAKLLADLKGEDPEGLRHMVLAYCTTALLNPRSQAVAVTAFRLIEVFRDNLWDSKFPGLVANCFRAKQARSEPT